MVEPKSIKVVTLGDANVGKTSLIKRFVENNFADEETSTIGAVFAEKNISCGPVTYSIQLYDTAGQDRFNSIARIYYQKSDVALLIYDVTNEASFVTMKNWNSEVIKNAPSEVIRIIVGNKADLVDQEKVNAQEVRDFAKAEGASLMFTSAKSAAGVQFLFEKMCQEYHEKNKNKVVEESRLSLSVAKLGNQKKMKGDEGCQC